MTKPPTELRKVLGRSDVVTLAFGAMVGWGWVVLAGEMVTRAGSIGSILAFGLGAIMVFLVGLTYAELTSALSRAGGEFAFTFAGLGPGTAFLCGWALILAYLSVCSFEAVALPTVVGYLFTHSDFEVGYLYSIAGWDVHLSWALLGVLGALLIGVVNYLGVRMATFVQWLSSVTLIIIGLAFFIPGNLAGEASNLTPLFTNTEGFLRVVIMTPFLFLGFDVIPQVAEEIDVPFKAVGKLILLSIVIAFSWYALVQWTVSLTLGSAALDARELPTADAMAQVYHSPWGGRALVLGGLMGIITSWNAFFIGASRLLFALSRGGMLPAIFSRLHPRYKSPVAAVVLLTFFSAMAPFLGRPALVWLVDAGALAAVIGYLLVTVSFLRIRRKYPHLPRPYQAPAPLLTGVLAFSITLFFIFLYLPGSPSALLWPYEWLIVLAWAALGFVFAVGRRRYAVAMSKEDQAERILGEYTRFLR